MEVDVFDRNTKLKSRLRDALRTGITVSNKITDQQLTDFELNLKSKYQDPKEFRLVNTTGHITDDEWFFSAKLFNHDVFIILMNNARCYYLRETIDQSERD